MSTLTEAPIPVPAAVSPAAPPASVEAKLDRILRLLDEQEQRRADLAEAAADLMPMANGLARIAIARLDALDRNGTLAAAAELATTLGEPDFLALAARTVDALRRPAHPVGLLGVWKALREPEVARGMGVAMALLRALGASASTDTTNPAPAAG
jgi:uncharacterized protein DUF1641